MLNTKRSTYYASALPLSTYSSVYWTKTCGVELNRGAWSWMPRRAEQSAWSWKHGVGRCNRTLAAEKYAQLLLPRMQMLSADTEKRK